MFAGRCGLHKNWGDESLKNSFSFDPLVNCIMIILVNFLDFPPSSFLSIFATLAFSSRVQPHLPHCPPHAPAHTKTYLKDMVTNYKPRPQLHHHHVHHSRKYMIPLQSNKCGNTWWHTAGNSKYLWEAPLDFSTWTRTLYWCVYHLWKCNNSMEFDLQWPLRHKIITWASWLFLRLVVFFV